MVIGYRLWVIEGLLVIGYWLLVNGYRLWVIELCFVIIR